MLLTTEGNLSC